MWTKSESCVSNMKPFEDRKDLATSDKDESMNVQMVKPIKICGTIDPTLLPSITPNTNAYTHE